MLSTGIIEPTTSEWSSPIVLIRKQDNTSQLCVDYCKLNQMTKTDAYPMPRVDDLIDQVGRAYIYS